jgi:hypothetical protein
MKEPDVPRVAIDVLAGEARAELGICDQAVIDLPDGELTASRRRGEGLLGGSRVPLVMPRSSSARQRVCPFAAPPLLVEAVEKPLRNQRVDWSRDDSAQLDGVRCQRRSKGRPPAPVEK